MYILLIGLVLSAILYKVIDGEAGDIVTLCCVIISLFMAILSFCVLPKETKRIKITEKKIVNANDLVGSESRVTGGLFVIDVHSKSKMMHTFYTKEGDKYNLESTLAENTDIYNDSKPRVVHYKVVLKIKDKYKHWTIASHDRLRFYKYELYVPKGTIKKKYKFNGK